MVKVDMVLQGTDLPKLFGQSCDAQKIRNLYR